MSSQNEFPEYDHLILIASFIEQLPGSLTQNRVVYSSIFPTIWIRGLSGVDGPRRQVFWDADLEVRLHELWRVVIVIQHRAQHSGRA